MDAGRLPHHHARLVGLQLADEVGFHPAQRGKFGKQLLHAVLADALCPCRQRFAHALCRHGLGYGNELDIFRPPAGSKRRRCDLFLNGF